MQDFRCRFSTGGTATLEVEERVLPDASCGQYEAGWWVLDPHDRVATTEDVIYREYFVNEYGIVFDFAGENRGWTKEVGIVPTLARRAREYERMID